jgi:glucan 1,3-beta-glucosidase
VSVISCIRSPLSQFSSHLSLPISYWSVPVSQDTGPYVTGAWPYILAALDWANAHGIHIILDLHGAPGSQNGFDNSGQRMLGPSWAVDQGNLNQTLQVIETIAREVGNKVAVIELLNEIAGFRGEQWSDAAKSYWQAGYNRIRAVAGNDVKVMIGDAFLGLSNWGGFMKGEQGVLMDLVSFACKHSYRR